MKNQNKTKKTKQTKTQTFKVQVRLGELFEDVIVTAKNEDEARLKAQESTTLQSRWAELVI